MNTLVGRADPHTMITRHDCYSYKNKPIIVSPQILSYMSTLHIYQAIHLNLLDQKSITFERLLKLRLKIQIIFNMFPQYM